MYAYYTEKYGMKLTVVTIIGVTNYFHIHPSNIYHWYTRMELSYICCCPEREPREKPSVTADKPYMVQDHSRKHYMLHKCSYLSMLSSKLQRLLSWELLVKLANTSSSSTS